MKRLRSHFLLEVRIHQRLSFVGKLSSLSNFQRLFHTFFPLTFYSEVRKKSLPGRIVVHDRAKVESQVLPRYFNHASFASLRRQLNYFAFSREGKGKQKGATYTNDLVYELNDILRLKRRLPGSSEPLVQKPAPTVSKKKAVPPVSKTVFETAATDASIKPSVNRKASSASRKKSSRTHKKNKRSRKIIDSVVPVVHLPFKKTKHSFEDNFDVWPTNTEHSEIIQSAKSVSPGPTLENSSDCKPEPILLDLTKPEPEEYSTASSGTSSAPENTWLYRPVPYKPSLNTDLKKEEDVIAGCSALLSLGWQKS
jgi:uncharacterized protein (DUF2249 family)